MHGTVRTGRCRKTRKTGRLYRGTSGRNSGIKSEITKQGIPCQTLTRNSKQKNRCQCLTRTEEKNMRKRIAMVLLGLSLAVGTPAATNMFPTVSAQTVQAAGKNRMDAGVRNLVFLQRRCKTDRLADLGWKKILSECRRNHESQ